METALKHSWIRDAYDLPPSTHGSPRSLSEECSQELQRLRIDGTTVSDRNFCRLQPSIELSLDSQGEIKPPGLSLGSMATCGSQNPRTDLEIFASKSGVTPNANATGSSAETSIKPPSRKRKANNASDVLDGHDVNSPLTRPPSDEDNVDASERADQLYDLPTRRPKLSKKAADESPAFRSHKKLRSGTCRGGTRKATTSTTTASRETSDKRRGKGKETAAATPADEAADAPGSSATKPQLRRSARLSAKRTGC